MKLGFWGLLHSLQGSYKGEVKIVTSRLPVVRQFGVQATPSEKSFLDDVLTAMDLNGG